MTHSAGIDPMEVAAWAVAMVAGIEAGVVVMLAGWWADASLTGWKALWGSYGGERGGGMRLWHRQQVWVQKWKPYADLITVNLGAGEGGMLLQICWPYSGRPLPRPWEMTLRVPWEELEAERVTRRRKQWVELSFRRTPRVRVRLREAVAREMAAEAGEWKGGEFLRCARMEQARGADKEPTERRSEG